jgi:hypothetical protein
MWANEFDLFRQWLAAPFTTKLPLMFLVLILAVFMVIAWIAYDNLDIVQRGYKTVEELSK